MNSLEKRELEKLIRENEAEDRTSEIRKEKRSVVLRREINMINHIMRQHPHARYDVLNKKLRHRCPELVEYYINIYDKFLNREPLVQENMEIMLSQLEEIEKGNTNQHEASVKVGYALNSRYVEPAVNTAPKRTAVRKMSYKEYIESQQKELEKNE